MRGTWRGPLRGGLAAVLLAVLSASAFGQAVGQPALRAQFVTGEMVITVPRGAAIADVASAAGAVKATVLENLGTINYGGGVDAYKLRLTGAATNDQTLAAVAALRQNPVVRTATPNYKRYADQVGPKVEPNDPRYPAQWGLRMINMPQAWATQKGGANAVVAVIDTGVDVDHEEFVGRALPGYNAITGAADGRPGVGSLHGTHVAGIAMAQANNARGVAGVAWDNVKLLPICAGDDASGFAVADLVKAIKYVETFKAANPDKAIVVNMSLGGTAPSDTPDLANLPADDQEVVAAAATGIVFCVSAGNSYQGGNLPHSPAYLAGINNGDNNILCVGACNHLRQRAYYSQARPYTTISAPGGDDLAGQMIISTLPVSMGGYGEEMGTSMATPFVSGGAAVLMSMAGVTPTQVKKALTASAWRVPGATVPSAEFGAGIMDVRAALLQAGFLVTVIYPDGSGGKAAGSASATTPRVVDTLRPTFDLQVSHIAADQLRIQIDDQVIADPVAGVVPPGLDPAYGRYWVQQPLDSSGQPLPYYDITFPVTSQTNPKSIDVVADGTSRYDMSPGVHTVSITGYQDGNVVATDTRQFTVAPHMVPQGRSMVSFPYFQPNVTPQDYLGADFRLARWMQSNPGSDAMGYLIQASYLGGINIFPAPTEVAPHFDGDTTPLYPLGLAFFSDTESAKPVLTRGLAPAAVSNRAFVIPLRSTSDATAQTPAWNMVGDPFPFDVPFSALMVDTPEGRLAIADAASRGYVLPILYSYDQSTGYSYQTLPEGSLRAWAGHWIAVARPGNFALVVPPATSTRAARPVATSAGSGGWTLRLSASLRDLRDSWNFIGQTSRAADGYDAGNDVPKPPIMSPYVRLAVAHDDWGSRAGLFARDLRATGGTAKQWDLVVNSDQANSDVLLNWSSVGTMPRGTKLTIKDETSGQTVDMRTRSSLTFNTGADAAARRFTVTARPTSGAIVRISNVIVGGGRASGVVPIAFTLSGDATYEVRMLTATGRSVATVATRAAGAGDVRVVWNGRDSAGRSIPAGTYLVQIRATGSDGDVAKVVQPFAVVR